MVIGQDLKIICHIIDITKISDIYFSWTKQILQANRKEVSRRFILR